MSQFGKDLIESMEQALAYAKGETVPGLVVHQVEVDDIDAKSVRTKLRLTQEQMASLLGTSTSGYRKWEQKERRPSGAARTLLKVMDREPEAILRALVPADA
jgi:putative transcriptional regulator